ncbi:MAG: type II secretion system GspH family protein [Pyrinomonadaceae bacterium]|nr:type II secretion system GspH family protein [Pyrinomonadaceae bacterium]MCX7639419.1 type II secretion system GspH family protein [Pyrinomonadaceae bacterium]MDW8304531.1 type II secretion system protein [Acidobacteriota bacterium]
MKKKFFQNINHRKAQEAYTLLELIITLTVISIMVLIALPLAENAVRRQKEMQLRESLRQIRSAIDEFKRDAIGACPQGAITTINPAKAQEQLYVPADPRSRVVIDDCTIFSPDNLDRYPPSLEILVEGVRVKPRGLNVTAPNIFSDETKVFKDNQSQEIKKVYLREIPIDPFTGKRDWILRSSYQSKDSDVWDGINVFDVRSASNETALNGEKYRDW